MSDFQAKEDEDKSSLLAQETSLAHPATGWLEWNNRFLAAALRWLRLKLRRRIAEAEPARRRRRFFLFWRWERGPSWVSNRELNAAYEAMQQAAATDPPPALEILARRFNLSEYERNILLLCAAAELDPHITRLFAALQNGQPHPTFALARALFDDPAWDALSPDRPLRYFRLLEINQPGAQPLTTSPMRADERIVSYLKGLNYLDDRLAPLFLPLDEAARYPENLSLSQAQTAETICMYVEPARQSGPGLVLVQLVGSDGLSKQLVATQTTAGLEPPLHLVRLPADWLPAQAADLENIARLWERERILLGLALYLDAMDSAGEHGAEGQAPPLARFLGRLSGVVFLDTREVHTELGNSVLTVDIEKPAPIEQANAWRETLQPVDLVWPVRLAGQFSLNFPTIREIARMAQAAEGALQPAQDIGWRAWQICLMHTRPRLDQLAQRIEAKAVWQDLELPKDTKDLLDEICDQVEERLRVYDDWGLRGMMNRGLGISALFAGESGTGKTMAAEVMARRLNLNLYRIDLSAVVSKYIGETEKNLRKLFDAAEEGGAILFFDEADALFGKRSEVKDSHDRYANIEVNYLLQRLEAFRGLAILATNLKSSLDQAFTRRLRFIINFPFPGVEGRKRIWMSALGPGVPVDLGSVDYERLARFNLTGGSIHNAALNVTFLAASSIGPVVTIDRALISVRRELRKMEKPIVEREFELQLTPAQRWETWQRAFGPDAPWKKAFGGAVPEYHLEEVDFSRLARFPVAPGTIYDIVVEAVQAAVRETPPVVQYAGVEARVRLALGQAARGGPGMEENEPISTY